MIATPTVDLASIGIKNWDDISHDFEKSDVLLGNGFSISFHSKLHYNSLFEKFLSECILPESKTFKAFGTSNFESIMEQLSSASKVNTILGLDTLGIESATDKLRDGLIMAVKDLHPRNEDIDWARIVRVSEALDTFSDVFTLNYDVLMYKILMHTNTRHQAVPAVLPFSDYFWQSSGDALKFMDFQNISKYRLVYYLHGALFLYKNEAETLKIKGNGTELIDVITSKIKQGMTPIFVSEGTHTDKERVISRSEYLSFSLRHLRLSEKSMVIYGASLADPDKHIRDAISHESKHHSRRKLAFSIYVGQRTQQELIEELANMRQRFPHQNIEFFDSSTLFQ